MRNKVLHWMTSQKLTHNGDTVVCAVSGGADSVAMLHVLLSLQKPLAITVQAAHFNHHLRGQEADRDEAFVRSLCKDWNVPLTVGHGDVFARAEKNGESIEEAARVLRYEFFDTLGFSVATAHTADDNIETVLLNLLRGTGLSGLSGIPPKRGKIIRPLLCLTREEIEAYLLENQIPHIEDSTNALDDCRRNRLRHTVLPLLKAENPALGNTVLRMTALLRQDEDYLQALAAQALENSKQEDGYSCAALNTCPDAVRTRAVRLLLQQIHAPKLSEAHIDAVDRLLTSPNPSASCDLPGIWRARREYDRLYLQQNSPTASGFQPFSIVAGKTGFIPECSLTVSVFAAKKTDKIQNTLSTFAINYDRILKITSLTLRPRQTGDCLHLSGGTKSLKKLMIDRKIPLCKRPLLPVLAADGQVIAVYGLGADPNWLAADGQNALVLAFEEKKEVDSYD